MPESVQTVVIGAGAVGLAVARALALSGREVVVLEAEEIIGSGTSSRNSEVIHSGIYYPRDSAKARLCVRGKALLYAYCESHGVAHRRAGKLIVATDESQLALLDDLKARAAANGVHDLRHLSRQKIAEREPALRVSGALLSPSTGLVDSHGLMLAFQGDAEAAGAMIAFATPVASGQATGAGILLRCGGAAPMDLACREVVNAAGLEAQATARRIRGLAEDSIPGRYLARGVYFTLAGRSPFSGLVYPVPDPAGGLGVHVTVDLGGQTKFGPDVEWIDRVDYTVDPARGERFYAAIRRYWPDLPDGALQPGYAGIRPKTHPKGSHETDFILQGPETHGVKGLVNLYGIESPGLTSSMAIAEEVTAMLDRA